ncbi:MAG: ATP-dependent DNA helicase [Candidatus Saliniplasma sp.]
MENKLSSPMNGIFPYDPRKNQKKIMETILENLNRGKSTVYQAATGSGKTICTLTPVLSYAEKHDKKVVYLTRTNSQQKQVIYETRKIGDFYALGIQGRNNTCLLAQDNEDLQQGTAEELSKYCSDRKKEVRTAIQEDSESYSCPYYAGMLQCDLNEVRSWAKKNIPTVDEFLDYCQRNELCAYELSKALIPEADLLVAPYIYFFLTYIRRNLLEWMNVELPELIVVIDEAHNLPDYARDLASIEITNTSLERALDEGQEIGDPELNENTTISSFCRLFENILLDVVQEFVIEEDGLIPPNEVRSELLNIMGINTNQFKGLIKDMKVHGEIVQEKKRKERKLPRSYIHSLSEFLKVWLSLDQAEYIKLVNGGDNPSLEGFCLDPSNVTEVLNHCHASVHQSATLEPLDEYRDSVGLPYDTDIKIFPSPFPEENQKIFYKEGVSTQYEALQRSDKMIQKLRQEVRNLVETIERNTIVFFPSYRLMNEVGGSIMDEYDISVEHQGMTQPELMETVDKFKSDGGVLFSVIGGRISEGMDFPGDELEVAAIVGIPYPKPTARQKGLRHYYDMKFNKGWEYTIKAPTVRKILQSTGRLVRSENDLGAAVILDERAVHFNSYLPDLFLTEEPVSSIQEFFRERKDL